MTTSCYNFDEYKDYFQYIGGPIFDAYMMNSIQKEINGIYFIINTKDASGYRKYLVCWKLDLNSFEFEEEAFINELTNIKHDAKFLVANISLSAHKHTTQGHRNILFIDLANRIFHLFEPNLQSHEKDQITEHLKIHNFFKNILESYYSKKYQSRILKNLGTYVLWTIINIIKSKSLIELIKNNSCSLFCYWFIIFITRRKDKLLDGDLDISHYEIEKVLYYIFDNISLPPLEFKFAFDNFYLRLNL